MTFGILSGILTKVGRIIFGNNNQAIFLQRLKKATGFSSEDLAKICDVSGRTFRDWLRGKYSISEKALYLLLAKLRISVPNDIKTVDDYWYATRGAKRGGIRRMELYGDLGTKQGRIKGGINSQQRRRENPEKYRLLGCNNRKVFKTCSKTAELAEVCGILLGDGGITNAQVKVSLSSLVDQQYSSFVASLFLKVFGERPSCLLRSKKHTIVLTISGIDLVTQIERAGLKKGNKVRNQVDIPAWIKKDSNFSIHCVRGLMDTDGGCYFHKHKSNGLLYRNFGMCFTNKSLPIVRSVVEVLKSLGLKFSVANKGTQIYIYSFEEIKKYFRLVGSNNPKNIKKFKYYLNQSTHRVGCESGLIDDPGKIAWG